MLADNSLFLVTGVNGLIASHVADKLLAAGHRVRGTVRDPQKSAWLTALLEARHGAGRFEMVQVADLGAPQAWDAAIRGVDGVASIAGTADIAVPDVDAAVARDFGRLANLLRAAQAMPSVQTFVYTSSIWAAYTPVPDTPMVVTEQSWNEAALARAADAGLAPEQKGIAPFMAVRTRIEQALWRWVEEERPRFAVNATLLDTVFGPILDAARQPASTAGMVRWVYDGAHLDVLRLVAPQWFVDVRDAALLYVALLTDPSVRGERLFGCAERYSWPRVREILAALYPERDFVAMADAGWDAAEMPTARSLELLGRFGQKAWIGLEASVKENAASFVGA